MSVEKKYDSLPKNVQKLVKKLAEIERKELALLQDETKDDVSEEIRVFHEQENKVIGDLFCTKFAIEEIGLCFPDEDDFLSDDLEEMGEYFLGLYALDRLYAEENNESYSEDLFYAGALLKQKAEAAAEEEELYDFDEDDDYDLDEEDMELNEMLDRLFDTFGGMPAEPEKKGKKPAKKSDGKVVPLFGEKKNRPQ